MSVRSGYVIVDGITFGGFEDPEPEAPCWGCRLGLRRAAVFYPPDGCMFDHVHLVRPGVTIECTGTPWKVEKLLRESDPEVN